MRKNLILAGALWFSGISFSITPSQPAGESDSVPVKAPQQPKARFALALLWEGEHIKKHNLDALQLFRKKFSHLPFIQFYNPADLEPGPRTSFNISALKELSHEKDFSALHIHAWKSFVKAAGVSFQYEPTFWGGELNESDCQKDCGHEVSLGAYSEKDKEKLIQHGARVLTDRGFAAPEAILWGGWYGGKESEEDMCLILKRYGLKRNFSFINPQIVAQRLQNQPLLSWITEQWKSYDHEKSGLDYTWLPVDYVSDQELQEQLESWAGENKGQTLIVALYQETAFRHVPRLEKALQVMAQKAQQQGISIDFTSYVHEIRSEPSPAGFPDLGHRLNYVSMSQKLLEYERRVEEMRLKR